MVIYQDSQDVSAEYVYWQQEEQKIRAFLVTTNRGMDAWLRDQWSVAEEEANDRFNPDYDDEGLVAEIYQEQIGVWPAEYFWQLAAAVLRDAVTLYEVFLETLANQVLRRAGHRLSTLETEDSWHWPQCRAFYTNYVGVDAATERVEAVLWIRNKVTHLRDGLRTEEGRAELNRLIAELGLDAPITAAEAELGLVDHAPYMGAPMGLTQLRTWRLLDIIAEQAGAVALAAFPYVYRRQTNVHLEALLHGSPLAVKDLGVAQTRKLFTR